MHIADFISRYFSLSEKHREIVRYLYVAEIKKRKGKFEGVFPSIQKLAHFASCCKRTVIRFNKIVCPELFIIFQRFRPNKSQTSNNYYISDDFFNCLNWLDRRNLLYEDPKRINAILRMAENMHVTPPSQESMSPPYSNPYSNPKEYALPEYIHPRIAEIGIPEASQIILSRYPEHAIMKGLEDVRWFLKKGNKPISPVGLLTERISAYAKG